MSIVVIILVPRGFVKHRCASPFLRSHAFRKERAAALTDLCRWKHVCECPGVCYRHCAPFSVSRSALPVACLRGCVLGTEAREACRAKPEARGMQALLKKLQQGGPHLAMRG